MSADSIMMSNRIDSDFDPPKFECEKEEKSEISFASKTNLVLSNLYFSIRFEFPDLNIVDIGPKIIKIGSEMTILEPSL